jgi:hypothetical protein
MSDKCKRCGHETVHHWHRGANCVCRVGGCFCDEFVSDDAPAYHPMERIAVALESIARSLDAMRRDGR